VLLARFDFKSSLPPQCTCLSIVFGDHVADKLSRDVLPRRISLFFTFNTSVAHNTHTEFVSYSRLSHTTPNHEQNPRMLSASPSGVGTSAFNSIDRLILDLNRSNTALPEVTGPASNVSNLDAHYSAESDRELRQA
jgi:hypothetical protein